MVAAAEEKYEVATRSPHVSMFLNEQRFEFAQRIGKMLAASTMLPDHFRNNLGNCLIALNLAERLGMDVFGLMQTSYVVHGRPGFEAKFIIAVFNARTELFIPPLRWEMKGDFPKGKDAACRAYAVDKATNEPLYGEWIDYDLVHAEGWDQKNGSKWLTMPGQMFRYRSASFFINAYEPGLKMGIHTVDELEDMTINVTPIKSTQPQAEPGKVTYDIKPVQATEPPPAVTPEPNEAQSNLPQTEPVKEEATVNQETDVMDDATKAFLEEAQVYEQSLQPKGWIGSCKLFGIVGAKTPKDLPKEMRKAFLDRCKVQLDKQNAA